MLCLCMMALCFGQSFRIETSQGPKQLVVPEGYTLEEAYCVLGQMYFEEKIEHDALIARCKELLSQVDDYVSKVDTLNKENESLMGEYNNLSEDYAQLSALYKKMNNSKTIQAMLGLRAQKAYTEPSYDLSIMAGVKFLSFYTYVDFGFKDVSIGVGFLI